MVFMLYFFRNRILDKFFYVSSFFIGEGNIDWEMGSEIEKGKIKGRGFKLVISGVNGVYLCWGIVRSSIKYKY